MFAAVMHGEFQNRMKAARHGAPVPGFKLQQVFSGMHQRSQIVMLD